MELHSPAVAKRLWKFLRIAFFMMRKGLISKRRLLMDMNLMMKRGKIFIMGKNFFLHHHHHQRPSRGYGFGLQEYEFSCTNTPDPVFCPARRRRGHYFPCLSSVVDGDRTPGPAESAVLTSPFSDAEVGLDEVDDAAEDFIRRFYEQLRAQSRIALIEYQEMEEYQETMEWVH